MRTVNVYTNGLVWTCPDCVLDNVSVLRRAEVDLNDPEHAELREQLIDEGEFLMIDEDDDDFDDDEFMDMDDMNIPLYFPPAMVTCGVCRESFRPNLMSVDESHVARQLHEPDESADD
jgi:hypothetical protein